MKAVLKGIAFYFAMHVAVLVVATISSLPTFPRTTGGWIAFLVLGPPLYLAGEWLVDRITRYWWGHALWFVLMLVLIIGGALLYG